MTFRFSRLWILTWTVLAGSTTSAFVVVSTVTTWTKSCVPQQRRRRPPPPPPHQPQRPEEKSLHAAATGDDGDDFSSFEASLKDEDEDEDEDDKTPKRRQPQQQQQEKKRGWQDTLEDLLDPMTPVSKRQTLLRELLSANQDIRSSVETAIRDRSIEPLLTTRGKRWQEGSRAVARQITSDILPELMQPPPQNQNPKQKKSPMMMMMMPPFVVPSPGTVVPSPRDLQKLGTRIFNALQNRFQSDLEAMQSDLQNDPLRSIPQRLSQQSQTLFREANNIFAETPAGLKEPSYRVVTQTADYEIRDYDAYTVASTNMAAVGEEQGYSYSLAQNGAAFQTLAAYVFGANKQGRALEMTTPVTTTLSGEMRFYLPPDEIPPEPLEQDESTTVYDKPGRILIQEIPPARLAVRRFTGFATQGEVARQKEALLASLDMDQVELDVPHGATVPHVVFQYNPPYTIPVLRRNEIAVAVAMSPTNLNGSSSSSSSSSTRRRSSIADQGNRARGSVTSRNDMDSFSSPSSSLRDNWEPLE